MFIVLMKNFILNHYSAQENSAMFIYVSIVWMVVHMQSKNPNDLLPVVHSSTLNLPLISVEILLTTFVLFCFFHLECSLGKKSVLKLCSNIPISFNITQHGLKMIICTFKVNFVMVSCRINPQMFDRCVVHT